MVTWSVTQFCMLPPTSWFRGGTLINAAPTAKSLVKSDKAVEGGGVSHCFVLIAPRLLICSAIRLLRNYCASARK
jgi:hypothetical protein